jgi:hypothetical protein
MSDVLMSPGGAIARAPSSRVRPKRHPSFDGSTWFPPRQSRAPYHRVRVIGTFDPGRLPLARCSTLRLSETDTCSLTVRTCSVSCTLCRLPRPDPVNVEIGNCRDALSIPARASLAANPSRMERCLLPASATDLRHEHPRDRSIPERLTCAKPTACHADTCSGRQCGAGFPCGNPNPEWMRA